MTVQFKRSISTEALEVEKEWMVLHADQFTVTVMNELGGFCWTLLREPQSLESLTDECLKEYSGVTGEQAAEDIRGFLTKLMDIGLIQHAC
jgi:hypothetical protein